MIPSSSILIRQANPADAPQLAEVHVAAWKVAYGHLIPASYINRLSLQEREERWRKNLQPDSPFAENATLLVALVHERIVGFCGHGPCRDHDRKGAFGEVWGINLHPDFWRMGVGSRLIQTAEDALLLHYADATLWVLEQNLRARAFYEQREYTYDGQQKIESFDDASLVELRMIKQLKQP